MEGSQLQRDEKVGTEEGMGRREAKGGGGKRTRKGRTAGLHTRTATWTASGLSVVTRLHARREGGKCRSRAIGQKIITLCLLPNPSAPSRTCPDQIVENYLGHSWGLTTSGV